MSKIALFPGSFDPFTKGHADIVERGSFMFDQVIIGIGINSNKTRFFEIDLMIDLINKAFEHRPNVSVQLYSNLTASFAKEIGANYLLRGLRNTTDFEYENSIAQANKHINGNLETVFLITSPHLAYISSTIVRELYKHGQDISDFVPYKIQ